MAQAWIRAGHQVEVITGFPNHPQGELYPGYQRQRYALEQMDGIQVHRVWTYITPNKGLIKRTLCHISLWFSALLFAAKHIDNPDVVIGTSPTLFSVMAARRLAMRKKIPFVMEVRDLWPGIFVDLGVIKNITVIKALEAWELWMYRQADMIVTVTEGFRENISQRGIELDKIHTVPNGADLATYQPGGKPAALAKDLGLEGKFVVLYLGAHSVSQKLDTILDAALVVSDLENLTFLFVGDGNQKEGLLERAKAENIHNLIFHPPVSKELVPSYYNLADICLVPLRDVPLFDTFIPSKMFEIMAVGKPILGSLKGEAARILESSGGALVTPPEDLQGIVTAIRNLYRDPRRRAELGQNGRKFVESHYSRKSQAAKYISLIQDIV
jgi:glycosyltransferase involved in cell wall biosynthesis